MQAAENPEALGCVETRLQLKGFLNVVLYVYYMHQTRDGTNISLTAKIILADYNMSKLKYP